MAGGRPDSGPVMAGVGSAAGAGGAGVWSAGFCPSACGGAAFCAPQTEAIANANTAIFVHIWSRIILLRRFVSLRPCQTTANPCTAGCTRLRHSNKDRTNRVGEQE